MGIERTESIRISATNNTPITPGMVFYLAVSLESVPNPKVSGKEGAKSLKKFTFALGDTILVLPNQDQASDLHCVSLTRGATRHISAVIFKGKEGSDDEDEDAAENVDVGVRVSSVVAPLIMISCFRSPC